MQCEWRNCGVREAMNAIFILYRAYQINCYTWHNWKEILVISRKRTRIFCFVCAFVLCFKFFLFFYLTFSFYAIIWCGVWVRKWCAATATKWKRRRIQTSTCISIFLYVIKREERQNKERIQKNPKESETMKKKNNNNNFTMIWHVKLLTCAPLFPFFIRYRFDELNPCLWHNMHTKECYHHN